MSFKKYKVYVVDFFIYAGVLIHLSMLLPSPLGPGAQDIGIHLALILLLFSRSVDFKKIFLSKLSLVFLIFFIVLAISTLAYSEWPEALNAIRSRFKAVSLFFTMQILCFSKKKNDNIFVLSLFPLFLVYITLGSFIPFLAGIQYSVDGGEGIRALGLWHNRTARLWNMVLPVTVTTFFIVKSRVLKVLIAFFVALALIGVPMTLSRTGTISLAALVFCYSGGILFMRRRNINTGMWIKGLAIVLLISFGGLVINHRQIKNRFSSAEWVSMTGRSDRIWPGVIEAVKKRPVMGYGFSSFKDVSEKYIEGGQAHSHNLFLHVLFKGGVVALALFVFLCLLFIRRSWEVIRKEINTFYGISFISVFITVILGHGMVEYIRFIPFAFFLSSIWLYEAYLNLSGKEVSGEVQG